MNALVGSGPGSASSNPRGIAFFSGKVARTSGGKKIDGIYTDPAGNIELFDPWGNHYHIIFDTNRDGNIDDPFTGVPVSESVLVWSSGPDGINGTPDDVKTW